MNHRGVLDRFLLLTLFGILVISAAVAEIPSLSTADVSVIESRQGGYDLWIRQKPGMGSVMLTESTESDSLRPDTFALRNPQSHPTVAEERRILDGEFLVPSRGYTLIDSTPEILPGGVRAFHIFLPYLVDFGYPWSRSGTLLMVDGSYFSIRIFEKPFGDYSGGYKDQPFLLRLVQKAPDPSPEPSEVPSEAPLEDRYLPDSIRTFQALSDGVIFSRGEEEVPLQIGEALEGLSGETLDVVIVLDTTESMRNDLPYLQQNLVEILQRATRGFSSVRIGMVLFRDYKEAYLTKVMRYESDWIRIQGLLDRVRILGGKDTPEAVHEGLYAGTQEFHWTAERRMMFLIGDAPPHARPRGKITEEMVLGALAEKGIRLVPILLPR